jgi:serine/threonine protein kinase
MYSLPIDIWGIGCIFAEMSNGKPLFRGDSEIDQIYKIFQYEMNSFIFLLFIYRICGTPSEQTWPDVVEFPDWRTTFPKWKPQPLAKLLPNLNEQGIDLLQVNIFF